MLTHKQETMKHSLNTQLMWRTRQRIEKDWRLKYTRSITRWETSRNAAGTNQTWWARGSKTENTDDRTTGYQNKAKCKRHTKREQRERKTGQGNRWTETELDMHERHDRLHKDGHKCAMMSLLFLACSSYIVQHNNLTENQVLHNSSRIFLACLFWHL